MRRQIAPREPRAARALVPHRGAELDDLHRAEWHRITRLASIRSPYAYAYVHDEDDVRRANLYPPESQTERTRVQEPAAVRDGHDTCRSLHARCATATASGARLRDRDHKRNPRWRSGGATCPRDRLVDRFVLRWGGDRIRRTRGGDLRGTAQPRSNTS